MKKYAKYLLVASLAFSMSCAQATETTNSIPDEKIINVHETELNFRLGHMLKGAAKGAACTFLASGVFTSSLRFLASHGEVKDSALVGVIVGMLCAPVGAMVGGLLNLKKKETPLRMKMNKSGLLYYSRNINKKTAYSWNNFKSLHRKVTLERANRVVAHTNIWGITTYTTVPEDIKVIKVGISFESMIEPLWINEPLSSLSYEGFRNTIEYFLGCKLLNEAISDTDIISYIARDGELKSNQVNQPSLEVGLEVDEINDDLLYEDVVVNRATVQ